ncbi:hypothetical protein [Flagellimonas beolgyonensis]|uniref:hypothetical protein n=1 Tax=Flagellimonas beolgyonensis TaxID=864064 RepID=UPI000F8F0FCC|nr:hypothetical protein [Allomuricauda beolgyonensis]
MKNTFKTLLLVCLTVFSFSSCEDGNKTIDEVLQYETGAVLRTINVVNAVLNSSDDSSSFIVEVEEQDEQDGALLESVDIYVNMRDLSPDNGTTTTTNSLVKTIPASAFTTGPVGLPRATLSATFGESVAALGIGSDDYFPGDLFIFELRLNLTDGRTFGAASAAGIITGGFFASPFQYNALLTCTPVPGDYVVDMHDTYGDGWQTDDGNGGSGIQVTLDDGTVIEIGLCSPYAAAAGTFLGGSDCTPNDGFDGSAVVTIPAGTSEANWSFPGDRYGEISFEVYAPDGTLLLAVGVGEGSAGLLAVTNCL